MRDAPHRHGTSQCDSWVRWHPQRNAASRDSWPCTCRTPCAQAPPTSAQLTTVHGVTHNATTGQHHSTDGAGGQARLAQQGIACRGGTQSRATASSRTRRVGEGSERRSPCSARTRGLPCHSRPARSSSPKTYSSPRCLRLRRGTPRGCRRWPRAARAEDAHNRHKISKHVDATEPRAAAQATAQHTCVRDKMSLFPLISRWNDLNRSPR